MTRDDIRQQRQRILEHLYDARLTETRARRAFVPEHQLRDALGDCAFNLGVLEELGHVERNGHRYRITAAGALAVEEDRED